MSSARRPSTASIDRAQLLRPRLGAEDACAERQPRGVLDVVGDRERVARRAAEDLGAQVLEQLRLARGVAARRGDGRAAEPLGAVVQTEAAGEEAESNVGTPSAEEVEQFYEANKAQISIPKAQALPQVRQYMIDSSRRRYRDMMINNLRRSFKVTTFLDPLRTNIATTGHPSRGPANAPVTIVEFGDFECPFCGAFYPTMKQVEKNYAEKMRLVYRQFPLTNMHPKAQKAAEASLCANEQGRFWEFYDAMFSDQSRLDVPSLKQRAQTLGLNTTAFNTCLDSGKQAGTILKDQEDAQEGGRERDPNSFHQRPLTSRQVFC